VDTDAPLFTFLLPQIERKTSIERDFLHCQGAPVLIRWLCVVSAHVDDISLAAVHCFVSLGTAPPRDGYTGIRLKSK